tara:strand:- start:1420 stop:2016 length:597 start_codon:yes stop_codon:yes gene_type:complete
MQALKTREKILLGICVGTIFLIANGFVARSIVSKLGGGSGKIRVLENELADYEMWLDDAPKAESREKWMQGVMPRLSSTLGKEQGDLLQELQDELLDRKLKIEQQSLQDIVYENFYTEVAVRLTIRGEEAVVTEWLTTLQSPEKFQVIKSLELKIDLKSKEPEPQAICQITIARWLDPNSDKEPLTLEATDAESEDRS